MLFQPTDGFATIGPSMQVIGRTDGMNEHGLVIGYNFVNSRQHGDGFVCNMIARIVLESCKTVREAVALLQIIPHKHAFNYCALDATGDKAIIEASTRNVMVRDGMACTNHFLKLTTENRYTMADSENRFEKISDFGKRESSLLEAYSLLNDWDGGIFAKKYSAWDGTIHTATYEPESLHVNISFGANKIPMPFSFRDWLKGKNSLAKSLKGELASENSFANK